MLTAFILAGLAAIYFGNKNKPIAANLTIDPQGPLLPAGTENGDNQGPLLPIPSNSTIDNYGPIQYSGQGPSLGKANEDGPLGRSDVTFSDDEALDTGKV